MATDPAGSGYWDDDYAGPANKITIDLRFLETAAAELEALQNFITQEFLPHFEEIHERMGTTKHNPFGGEKVDSGPPLWTKHNAYLNTARSSYKTIAEDLGDAAKASREIADQYRTVEARNEANVMDIEKAFQSDEPSASPAGDGYDD